MDDGRGWDEMGWDEKLPVGYNVNYLDDAYMKSPNLTIIQCIHVQNFTCIP